MSDFRPLAYLQQVREELSKVSWPTRNDTVRNTIIVIVGSVVIVAFFALADWILNAGLQGLLKING